MANLHSPEGDYENVIDKLKKCVDSALRQIDRAEVYLEDVQMTISAIEQVQSRPAHPAGAVAAVKATLQFVRTEELLAAEAARGAGSIETLPLPDGSTKFIIDGLRSVSLTPMPAALLSILIADTGPSEDGLVAWKSRREVARRLAHATGQPMKRGTLNNLVYRLREALHGQALHPDFICRDRRRGLRFALRRTAREP